MATAALRRAVTAFTRPSDPPDADLLRRFAADRSEDAFAALVRRHGPLVLGVCRRVVPDSHLADDAFQAAFVVLARRAGGIDPARPLGPWLYGVAHRVALRARTMIGRRRKRETLAAAVPEVPHPPPAVDDAAAVLDEEIGKLPAASRDAVILCELQGLSRRDAAARLGIAEGTLSSRLAAARKTLAARLQSRGVVLSVALATAAAVPSDLVAATVAAGTGVSLSSVVVSLADGASAMTLLNKLKLATVAAVFALSALGYGLWPAGETAAAPVPKEKPDAGLIWTHNVKTNTLTAHTPDGKEAKKAKLPDGVTLFGLTPDGGKMAFGKSGDNGLTLHVGDITDKCEGTDTGVACKPGDLFVWSPDAKRVVRATRPRSWTTEWEHTLHDLAARAATPIELPADHRLAGWSADGKQWRVVHTNAVDPKLPPLRWSTTPAGGKLTLAPVCDAGSFESLDPHPDGGRLLAAGSPYPAAKGDDRVALLVVADGKSGVPHSLGDNVAAVARWSPDGTRVACLRFAPAPVTRFPHDAELVVTDPDGKNATTLFTAEGDGQATRLLGWFPTPQKIKAPVPPVKAKLPAKLDRVPDAPDELRKELAGWDSTYRHQSEEKFAELEKRAEELAKEQTNDHDRARVWYAVAHVAAQSDIRNHTDRVRKYAEKCLKLSRDPLDRAYLYSYLASCEELSKGEPADRRKKATEWLLTGYLELLVQELPDERPELPGVEKFDVIGDPAEEARARAKHAAQVAAREQAKWACDQIDRRDVLVMHLRNFDVAELRKAAEAKLPTAKDVDKLLERVRAKE